LPLDLSQLLPVLLTVSLQVDFVGEYHIDLLQRYGAVPILIPRTLATTQQLEAYLIGGEEGGNDK